MKHLKKFNENVNSGKEIYAIFRSRDMGSFYVDSHKEVVPMGYANSLEEFDNYVKDEYPKAEKKENSIPRAFSEYYYSDGSYNIFYHVLSHVDLRTTQGRARMVKSN